MYFHIIGSKQKNKNENANGKNFRNCSIKHSKHSQNMAHKEFNYVFHQLHQNKLLKKLKIYRKISFGTDQLRKLSIVLYVILLQQVV